MPEEVRSPIRAAASTFAAFLLCGLVPVIPYLFGSTDAFHALLRDTARYGVMAVGMTFVIANKDLDLSVGSTFGLIGVINLGHGAMLGRQGVDRIGR